MEFGTLQKRRFADLVVLDQDPLQSIDNTRQISAVFKSGEQVIGNLAPTS